MDKSIKIGNLCNFREKKYCRDKECIFFGFLPPTSENMKKTLKKSLFRQNFLLYSNCIYYTCKSGFSLTCR